MGLFIDGQMLPAAGLVSLAAGWFYAGGGGLVARTLAAALILLPVGVMAVDNRAGGIVAERAAAWWRWYRHGGVFGPGACARPESYSLEIDEQDALVLERERLARVNLESVYSGDA